MNEGWDLVPVSEKEDEAGVAPVSLWVFWRVLVGVVQNHLSNFAEDLTFNWKQSICCGPGLKPSRRESLICDTFMQIVFMLIIVLQTLL